MMHPRRWKAGTLSGLLLSLLFAALLTGVATVDLFLMPEVPSDGALPFTIRIPSIGLYTVTITGGASYQRLSVRAARGKALSSKRARLIQTHEDMRRPPKPGLLFGLVLALGLVLLLLTHFLRRVGGLARLFRSQLTILIGLALLAALGKVLLLFTDYSALWIPLLAIVIPLCVHLRPRAGAALGISAAMVLAVLNPIDLSLFAVFVAQVVTFCALFRRQQLLRSSLVGALVAGLAGLFTYVAVSLLSTHFVPLGQLAKGLVGLDAILQSDLVAAFVGPLFGAALGVLLSPIFERAFGLVPASKLAKLAHFEHPLLRRLSTRAPGTWAHSLNMANFAEMAANAIGASGLLVRVGAYYHDLGKSIQPEYFIENQTGENPHDTLPPDVSADAIFAHVEEGVELARKQGVPEAVVEFIYTHHANDRLEYFWHKSKQMGDDSLSEADFRYPGMRPNSRETGILAICDAVEAASRTLESPDMEDLKKLVRQIIFTKLEKGILDCSELTMEDLRKISESLVETLRSSMHGRVKYPWQEEDNSANNKSDPEEVDEDADTIAVEKRSSEGADLVEGREHKKTQPASPKARPRATGPGAAARRPVSIVREESGGSSDPAWVDNLDSKGARDRVHTRPLGESANDD